MEKLTEFKYAPFWDRVGAYLLDGLLIGVFSFAINYVNIIHFKSFYVYLPIAIVAILYKPIMESTYGATFGKMALNLKVKDEAMGKINFEKSLLRSAILIFPALLYIPVHFLAFENTYILASEGYSDFSARLSYTYPALSIFTSIFSMVYILDVIMMATDKLKKRSLKDRIAKTFVVKE